MKSKEDLCEISMTRMGRCVTSVLRRVGTTRYGVRPWDKVAVGPGIIGVSGVKVWNARAWRLVAPRSKVWVYHLICTSADCHSPRLHDPTFAWTAINRWPCRLSHLPQGGKREVCLKKGSSDEHPPAPFPTGFLTLRPGNP